jgi:hypothetical protein
MRPDPFHDAHGPDDEEELVLEDEEEAPLSQLDPEKAHDDAC